jgi:hypothetical protein
MRRMTVAGALLAMTLLGAACGDDDDGGSSSERGEEYVDAFMASSEDDSDFSEDETECFSRALVDAVGVDELEAEASPEEIRESDDSSLSELGITLDEEQADALWDDVSSCVDVRELFLDEATAEAPEAARECIDDALGDDLLKRLFLTGLTEGDDAVEEDDELTSDLEALGRECEEAFQGS